MINSHEFFEFMYYLLTLLAFYVSFKCNDGFSFDGFTLAIAFPPIYIIYHLAVSRDKIFS
jgi:hypothetical protein